ncbi:MAG: hypothetical protein LC808_38860 [Actinobacteria bacterium]|nr:hypothetical protein [Actinomycetota bacterium]
MTLSVIADSATILALFTSQTIITIGALGLLALIVGGYYLRVRWGKPLGFQAILAMTPIVAGAVAITVFGMARKAMTTLMGKAQVY